MTERLVTIVIPTYNRVKNLLACLESCRNLKYGEEKFEIVVVDDASTDETESEMQAFLATPGLCVRYLRNEHNKGIGASRNAGVASSQCPYLVFIDDDVLVPESWLDEMIVPLQNPKVGVVGGPDLCPPKSSLLVACVDYAWTSFAGTGGIRRGAGKYLPRGYNMSMRREVLEKLGPFKTQSLGEDIELSNRARAKGYKLVYRESGFLYHRRRTHLSDLTTKIFARGMVRSRMIKSDSGFFSLALSLPAALVAISTMLIFCAPFSKMCRQLSLALFLVYGAVIIAAGIHAAFKIKKWRAALLVPLLLILQHYSYGMGLIRGAIAGEKYSDH